MFVYISSYGNDISKDTYTSQLGIKLAEENLKKFKANIEGKLEEIQQKIQEVLQEFKNQKLSQSAKETNKDGLSENQKKMINSHQSFQKKVNETPKTYEDSAKFDPKREVKSRVNINIPDKDGAFASSMLEMSKVNMDNELEEVRQEMQKIQEELNSEKLSQDEKKQKKKELIAKQRQMTAMQAFHTMMENAALQI